MPVTIINKEQKQKVDSFLSSPVVSASTWALHLLPNVKTPTSSKALSVPSGSSWLTFDIKQMKTAPLVRLMEATHMYQPVSGSSEGSRYFMVAASLQIKMAARYRNNQLSMRLEGDFHKYKALKGLSDFEIKSDNHASLHTEITDAKLAAKTLGAVMLDLDIMFETPIPNFYIIKAAS